MIAWKTPNLFSLPGTPAEHSLVRPLRMVKVSGQASILQIPHLIVLNSNRRKTVFSSLQSRQYPGPEDTKLR